MTLFARIKAPFSQAVKLWSFATSFYTDPMLLYLILYLSLELKRGDALGCDRKFAPFIVINFRLAILMLRDSPLTLIGGRTLPRCKPMTSLAAVYLLFMLWIGYEIGITLWLLEKMSTHNSPRHLNILIAAEIISILIKMLALRRHHADADQHVYCFRRGDAGFVAVEKIVQEIEGGGGCETPKIRLEDDAAARPGLDAKNMSESQERSASRTQQ